MVKQCTIYEMSICKHDKKKSVETWFAELTECKPKVPFGSASRGLTRNIHERGYRYTLCIEKRAVLWNKYLGESCTSESC